MHCLRTISRNAAPYRRLFASSQPATAGKMIGEETGTIDCGQWNCSKKAELQLTRDTIRVHKSTGKYMCSACKASGNWEELLDKTSSLHVPVIQSTWSSAKSISLSNQAAVKKLRKNCGIELLSEESLAKYEIRVASVKGRDWLAMPWHSTGGKSIEKLLLQCKTEPSSYPNLSERVKPFGWHTVQDSDKTIIITASEIDAVAVHQSTGLPAMCLSPRLAQSPLDYLSKSKKLVLWLDEKSRSKLDRILDLESIDVRLVRSNTEAPLEALNKGRDLNDIINSASSARHEKILDFRQLRDAVYHEIAHPDQVAGIPWQRFPSLTKILKGHRRGELTVFTGPTGSGKTTFMSEYSLDLCMQGVKTLWGSFEVRNTRLIKMMISQFSGLNLEKNAKAFDYWADKFEKLGLYFMSFHGAQTIYDVINTMSHAADVFDIQHVVIDNLQFMMSTDLRHDRFHFQDVTIAEFRKFATLKNVHVTLVIHPRKENDDVDLRLASIFGSAKATQEADNVLILQAPKLSTGTKQIQVMKNRFSGTLGKMGLQFNPESLSMCGYTAREIESEPPIPVKKKIATGKKTAGVGLSSFATRMKDSAAADSVKRVVRSSK